MDTHITTEDPVIKQSAAQTSHPGVLRLQHLIVNSYLVGEPGTGEWAVVDTGLAALCAANIIVAAERRFGRGARPAAILLTHGHFDHAGALRALLRRWDVPVYAHELELPYLTGRSAYPPPDPTVGGGLMARVSGLYPRRPIHLGARIQALPADGLVPGMPGWRWVHTPGHTPGHVSLFRFSDRLLIAGDAFVTVKQESLWAILTQRQQVHGPPAYFTSDWEAARRSLETLVKLDPEVAATGHGIPMRGGRLRMELAQLLEQFHSRAVPAYGRYVARPVLADHSGVVSLPPAVADPFQRALTASIFAVALLGIVAQVRRKRIKRLQAPHRPL